MQQENTSDKDNKRYRAYVIKLAGTHHRTETDHSLIGNGKWVKEYLKRTGCDNPGRYFWGQGTDGAVSSNHEAFMHNTVAIAKDRGYGYDTYFVEEYKENRYGN